jgi:flavin-binding protein dodecin
MMMSFNDPRRGYDDRYDGVEYGRHGRSFELGSYERQPRRYSGDWMRESPWARELPFRTAELEGTPMMKVIEVHAQSPHSWEDATRRAIAEASRTISGIRSIYIEDMHALVDDEHVVSFRINAKISFAPDDHRRRR